MATYESPISLTWQPRIRRPENRRSHSLPLPEIRRMLPSGGPFLSAHHLLISLITVRCYPQPSETEEGRMSHNVPGLATCAGVERSGGQGPKARSANPLLGAVLRTSTSLALKPRRV